MGIKIRVVSPVIGMKVEAGKAVYLSGEPYEGEYTVIPSTDSSQTLKTAQKFMSRDVTVQKIPYFEVSNNSGGMTVSIGNEV